jgi:hypothetical protein
VDELYKGSVFVDKSGLVKFDNLQKIEPLPISKRKLTNFGPGVQHGRTYRKSGGHG